MGSPRAGPLDELIGESPAIAAVRAKIARLLSRSSEVRRLPPVLIQGETGTGKGLTARAIHRVGPRAGGPFVDVNCAAIPETLLEAEMFGFERGAFTDARQAKRGLFQTADKGTLFLDEIGLMPEGLQAKLLKVIEERTVRRLGSTQSEPVDVWVIAATSTDLAAATRERRFREDLYHRIAVLTITLPPLRERGQDILLLAEHLLRQACADYDLPPKTFTGETRACLLEYGWPGNVRELANVMERVALLSEAASVTPEMLGFGEAPPPAAPAAAPPPGGPVPLAAAVDQAERSHLLEALEATGWNVTRAAARLAISRNTLRYRIEKHGLRPGAPPVPPGRRSGRSAPAPPAVPIAIEPAPPGAESPVPAPVRWERRRLTLMRAGVARTDLAGTFDPSRLLETIVDKVRSFGGRVEELSPTGVVAVFGLDPVEDAPRRAATSAMAIQRAAEYVASRTEEGPGPRIAIHVGQFTVGRLPDATQIDAEGKREAWPVLETLAAGAEPGTTLVSAAAAAFLRRQFDLVAREGRPDGDEGSYRLAGRERRPFGPGQRVSEFVGRLRELELLRTLLAAARERRGQIVGIVGEPGIGKSRLLHEFRQTVHAEPVTYLEAHCLEYGSTMPYLPVLDILRQNCRIVESDLPAAIVEKVRGALQEVGLDPEAETPYLLHLLGLEEGTRALSGLNPDLVRSRGVESLRQLALRGSRRRPLVLVIEDLHWMDTASREVVASLVESLPGAPILFVATYRPGFRPAWMERSYATQISLQPLTPVESRSIVQSVLGEHRVDAALVDLILARAEGNPFFLEELVRTVREQGAGAAGRPAAVTVPDTVEEALLARIDRLPLADKRLIQAAAVVGRSVPLPVLQAIADLPDDRLRQGLLRLQAAEFVYESTLGVELDYTFKHALTHEVAYESLLEAERRAFHVRIVDAIERIYADRLAEQTERLAHHALRGGEWGKALGYLRQAGTRAALRSAHREGVAYLEQALVVLGRLPQSQDTLAQAVDLRFELRTTLAPLGEHERTYEHLREAEPLARTLGDPRRLARVQAYLTDYFRQVGEGERAVESGQRALAMAEALGDFPLRVAASLYLTQAHFDLGRYRAGSALVRQVLDGLAGDRSHERLGLPYVPAVHARTFLIVSLAELGEFGEALAQGEEALRIAEAVDHPFSLASACSGLGRVYLRSGDLPGAVRVLERGIEVSRAWSIRVMFTNLAADLGSAYALGGRLSEGLPLLEQAVEQHAAMRRTAGHAIRLTSLGEAYLLAGRTGEAARLAERAGQLAEQHAERGNQAYAFRLAGEIAARVDGSRPETAEGAYRKAIALAEELGMTPLLAHGHLGLGRLFRRVGNRAAAEPQLRRAIALYETMGTRGWLGQAEAELRR